MGCDIHGVVQTKWHDEGAWDTDISAGFDDDRNYLVFAILAGVRNRTEIEPISEPRGIPGDFVFPGDSNFWLGDHSFTWLSLNEILSWPHWDGRPDDYYAEHYPTYAEAAGSFYQWIKWLEVRMGHRDVRLVFGFDS